MAHDKNIYPNLLVQFPFIFPPRRLCNLGFNAISKSKTFGVFALSIKFVIAPRLRGLTAGQCSYISAIMIAGDSMLAANALTRTAPEFNEPSPFEKKIAGPPRTATHLGIYWAK